MPTPFWRSAERREELQRLDRAAFAMEFLRRNRTYQDECARLVERAAQGTENVDELHADFARRWGLVCRRRR